MAEYCSTSTVAEEFINDGKIRQTLAFAASHKDDLELMRAILEKGREICRQHLKEIEDGNRDFRF